MSTPGANGTALSPAEQRDILRLLKNQVAGIPALRDTLAWRQWAEEFLQNAIDSCDTPVAFRYLGADNRGYDRFEVGHVGAPLRIVSTRLRGAWWAWAAIDDGGRSNTLLAGDFAKPDVVSLESAINSTRKSLRAAAALARRWRIPELRDAILCIAIVGGVLRYDPPVSAPRVITK